MAVEAVASGMTALKMDVDEPIESGHAINGVLTGADLRLTEEMVRSVREAVGVEVELCIDGHGAFDVPSAIRLAQALRDYGLMWIEDPVSMNSLKAMARVALESETPICTGELLDTRLRLSRTVRKSGGGYHHAGPGEDRWCDGVEADCRRGRELSPADCPTQYGGTGLHGGVGARLRCHIQFYDP